VPSRSQCPPAAQCQSAAMCVLAQEAEPSPKLRASGPATAMNHPPLIPTDRGANHASCYGADMAKHEPTSAEYQSLLDENDALAA